MLISKTIDNYKKYLPNFVRILMHVAYYFLNERLGYTSIRRHRLLYLYFIVDTSATVVKNTFCG